MKKTTSLILSIISIAILSCGEKQYEQTAIKDPNEVKPMAHMMRTMADYCDSMRIDIKNHKLVDSIRYPLMPFWTAEPTDSSVFENVFYTHAQNFAIAYRNLMANQEHQAENYTLVINQCMECHGIYCSGPLKRIKKLPLTYQEK
ncbi:MAG: hypothetical protein R2831_00250 [Chitinophagaceae bacterium]